MVVLDFSMIPIGQGESVSPFVARMVDVVDRSGLDYRCHAMGTTIEGDLEQVFAVVKDCFQALAADCSRIACTIKLDYRKGYTGRLNGKVASVEKKLGRPVKK